MLLLGLSHHGDPVCWLGRDTKPLTPGSPSVDAWPHEPESMSDYLPPF